MATEGKIQRILEVGCLVYMGQMALGDAMGTNSSSMALAPVPAGSPAPPGPVCHYEDRWKLGM